LVSHSIFLVSNISHNLLYLRQLLNTLTPVENRRLLKYLSLNDDFSKRNLTKKGTKGEGKSQYVKFIQLISQFKGEDSVSEIENFIGKSYSVNQRRSISSRLTKRIDDFLLMELTLNKANAEDDRIVQQFLLRRIVILDVLLSRGLFDHFKYVSNKLVVLADRYERYLEGASIVRMQMSFLVNRIKSQEYSLLVDEHNLKIKKYTGVLECHNFAVKIQQMYNEKYKVENVLDFIKIIIEKLNNNPVDSDTWRVSRNLIFLEYYQQTGDYKKGDLYCYDTISIYSTNKYISNVARLSNAYRQLANNQMLDSRFEESIDSISKAIIGYPIPSFNWVACKEHLFLSNFYLMRYETAKQNLDEVLSMSKLKTNLKLMSRMNYYNGVISFNESNFYKSIKCFYDSGNLHDDKGGWGFGLRMYTLMIYIELKDIDSVLIAFDSFRKYYAKYNMKGEISARFRIIFHIFKNIVTYDFDFKLILFKSSDLFLKLKSVEYKWEIKSPEILNFEDWFTKFISDGNKSV
jgi:hypothetical protein